MDLIDSTHSSHLFKNEISKLHHYVDRCKKQRGQNELVQYCLACKKWLQSWFLDEKIREVDLQYEAAKLFKLITAQARATSKQHAAVLQKVTDALEHLPAQIAEVTEVNPTAALFSETPALLAPTQTLMLNPDDRLVVVIIRKHGLIPPSELDYFNNSSG